MTLEKRATIRQVATAAAVSIQTVSRVLNNHPHVADGTRQRVLRAISELRYRPDTLARSMILRRSFTIGVVVAEIEYYGPNRMLAGIEGQAAALGYSLLLSVVHSASSDYGAAQLDILLSRQVDGIIWSIPQIDTNYSWLQSKVQSLGIPIICTSSSMGGTLPTVLNDNRGGARMATAHLIAQGYRNIGLLNGPAGWTAARDRLLGWQDALAVAGIAPDSRRVVEGDWTAASGAPGLRQLLAQFPKLDAVFAGNDQMALGLLQAAHIQGLRVPEDLGIIGYDALPESAYFWPPLSSVRQHLLDVGSIAVRELAQRIELAQRGALQPTTSIVIPPELIIRASSLRRGK